MRYKNQYRVSSILIERHYILKILTVYRVNFGQCKVAVMLTENPQLLVEDCLLYVNYFLFVFQKMIQQKGCRTVMLIDTFRIYFI